MTEHENLVSKTLNLPSVKEQYFSDFNGSIKSLGAWGGDFVLAASPMNAEEVQNYFKEKGCDSCISYTDFILDEEG